MIYLFLKIKNNFDFYHGTCVAVGSSKVINEHGGKNVNKYVK
jgi:hypothetical protein